jgi:hypothetical protein
MRIVNQLIIVSLCSIGFSGSGRAQPPAIAPDVRDAATALMEVTGSDATFGKIVDALRSYLVQNIMARGHVTQEKAIAACDNLLIPAMKAQAFELRSALIEIYAENFSASELKAMKAFYDTPVGHKMLEKMPIITKEIAAAGSAWGMHVARDAMESNRAKLQHMGITL